MYGSGKGDVVVARKWNGGPQGQWSVAENWDKGHYPTQRSRVEVNSPSVIEVSQQGLNARSLDFTDANTTLRMTSGGLDIREDMTLGSSIDSDHTNRIDVENGTLRIDGNLRMAEGPRSQSVLNIANGQVEIGNRVTHGEGTSRIIMSGGTLTVAGTKAGPTLASSESTARILIPNDDSLARDWTDVRFDDSQWQEASSSLGYERSTGFEGLFATDLEAAMFDKSTTVYVRIPFQAEDASSLNKLDLDVNFDDGFVAYLNGQRVAARNAANVVAFDERALTSVSDDDATKTLTIDISQHLGKLVDGENVLAIHGLNRSKTNDDFLLVPRLRTRISDGSIEVDTLEFSGGKIFGVTRIDGSVALNGGEFSPSGATANSGPSELRIAGRLDIANEAALRLDVGTSTNDLIIVDGPISLGGELRLVSTGTIENLTERGTFEQRQLLEGSTVEGRYSLVTFDETPIGHMGDGLFRQLSYTDTDVSLLSFRTIAGDANGDGEFDSGDLVFVFQTDEYEDGIEANSDWTEGDWNGDHEFDSGDFIAAFQTGFYETGSILPNMVPEPQTNGLVVIIFMIIGFKSRRRTRVWR
jgi:hypothetical protein